MVNQGRLIGERMRQAQDQQKSYVYHKRHELEFEVGDYVFFKIALYRHVMRFGKKGKLVL